MRQLRVLACMFGEVETYLGHDEVEVLRCALFLITYTLELDLAPRSQTRLDIHL